MPLPCLIVSLILAAQFALAAAADEPAPSASPSLAVAASAPEIFETSRQGPLISLRLENTDVRSALRVFAELLGVNVVVHRQVVGRIGAMRLTDVPVDQAFELLLNTLGLRAVQEGSVVIIYPLEALVEDQRKRLELKRMEPE